MPNTFFKYKQFTVHQEKTAQKVCTDTSLFGALVEPNHPKSILDIGTGTGVLSLFIAQKTEGNITAIEIEENAYNQALGNFKESKWFKKLEVIKDDIKCFAESSNQKFDLIISNPPFFQNSFKAEKNAKNLARHNDSLSLHELAMCVQKLLSKNGEFWVLLPEFESNSLCAEFNNIGIRLSKSIIIKNYVGDNKISRVVNCFSFNQQEIEKREIAIYQDENREYTSDFVALLKPYYLYL